MHLNEAGLLYEDTFNIAITYIQFVSLHYAK